MTCRRKKDDKTKRKYLTASSLHCYDVAIFSQTFAPFFDLKSLCIRCGIIQTRRLFAFAGAVGFHEGTRSDGSTGIFPEILPRRSPPHVTIEFALTVVGSSRTAFAD